MKKVINKKEWIIIVVLIILLISVPFIIGGSVKVHEWEKPISIDNWLIYYATICGSLIGGFITALGLYITIKQTREIQKETKKNIQIERVLNKYKIEIEYLKELYKISYDYENYMVNDLEKEIVSIVNREINKIDAIEYIARKIYDYNTNIVIEASCIQIPEISKLIKEISELKTELIFKIADIVNDIDAYKEQDISKLFTNKNEKFVPTTKLLIILNKEIVKQIKKIKNEFNNFCDIDYENNIL
ncbi:hypothetical protein [Clostridium perfringens]|uniref:hypothetical protein n=1 Tax=Clostridium perfringens TaxID=1502 RepID=UPI0030D47A8E